MNLESLLSMPDDPVPLLDDLISMFNDFISMFNDLIYILGGGSCLFIFA